MNITAMNRDDRLASLRFRRYAYSSGNALAINGLESAPKSLVLRCGRRLLPNPAQWLVKRVILGDSLDEIRFRTGISADRAGKSCCAKEQA